MKKLFSLFMVSLCAFTMIHAEEVTLDLATGKHDGAKITWMAASDNITITQNQGQSTTAVNANYISGPRMYKGHYLGFECATNYTINKVEIVCGDRVGSDIKAGTEVVENNVVKNDAITCTFGTKSGESHTFTSAAGVSNLYIQNSDTTLAEYTQLRFTAIKITYTKAATTQPTITAANTFEVGTVASASAFEPQVLKVVGENLTALTYAIKEADAAFTVTGTLSATGGDLTVTCTATTPGTHTATLVLTGTPSVTKEVLLTATILDVEGDGTKENPFTVADVIKLSNVLGTAQKYWVKGIILGAANNDKIVTDVNSNIVLGATADAEHPNWVPVQLPSGDVRTALNVKDNAANIGKTVKLYGTLDTYFSMPGVKNTTEYEWVEGGTAVENVTANKVAARKIIENGQVYILRDGVKYNIFGAVVD